VSFLSDSRVKTGTEISFIREILKPMGLWYVHPVCDVITLVLTLRQGPLIVHSLSDVYIRGRDYDHERVLFISDWK
jgi:hypothetical protein